VRTKCAGKTCVGLWGYSWGPRELPGVGGPGLGEAGHYNVMEHSKDTLPFLAKVDQDYFKGGCGALLLNIVFSSVYNLITLASLDVTFMRLWTL
jgi:hypothetical protein